MFLKFFLGFLQAQPGAFKADLVPRVYGGKHRSVGGLIATRSPRDRIDKLADSLTGEAGNGDERRFSKSRISNPVPDEINLVRGENLAVLRFFVAEMRDVEHAHNHVGPLHRSLRPFDPFAFEASSVSRRPAVSVIRKGIPRRLANSSIVSRVVPGEALTMAR